MSGKDEFRRVFGVDPHGTEKPSHAERVGVPDSAKNTAEAKIAYAGTAPYHP